MMTRELIPPSEHNSRHHISVANSAGHRQIDKDGRKAAPNATLVQSGQSVARGSIYPPSSMSSSSYDQHSHRPNRKRAMFNDSPRTLDGFLLLDLCRVEFPDEVVQAILSDMHIANVVAEDLLFFTNLARLDMSDNEVRAPLDPFGCLPALIELEFQCNALEEITLGNGFQTLEVLNVSFNCLRSKDVEELSNLPQIRELYLGSNRIRSLPPVMDRFSRLETLSLESNNLSGQEVFYFLAIMPRLRNLNLSYNKITGFPESALTLDGKRGAGFYNLIYLNLAHNKITEEEAVVHTCALRNLRKLILYGNPLADAAVTTYDPTKLSYDPVPSLTALLKERNADQIAMSIMVAYPSTKKKKLHSMSCYESVEIYKMIPNEVALQSPFRNKATEFLLRDIPDTVKEVAQESPAKKQSDDSAALVAKLLVNSNDNTFLTGVGIEDVLMGAGSSKELPAVPACMVSRSLAATSKNQPLMNTQMAVNALRYQLDHPLTSHDDSELFPAHSQQLTKACLQRQRPRRPRNDSLTSPSRCKSVGLSKHKGVDDALTQLSQQVSTTWDKRAYGAEQGINEALDSLISTAKKLNLTYNHPTHGSG